MKRILAIITAVLLMAKLSACGESEQSHGGREFTDDAGRTVTVTEEIDRLAVTGTLAQLIVFALAPDKLVGLTEPWSAEAAELLDEKYTELPMLGQLYGGKGALNYETLIASGAQVVIDVGEAKESVAGDMDALSKQTGIPFVHIDASLEAMGETYRALGELLDMSERAEVLAERCESVYEKTAALSERVEKVRALYLTGTEGLNVIARGSYHAELFDLLTDNLAVLDEPSAKGTGNEVDLEQLIAWDPDVIIFAPGSVFGTVGSMPEWQSISAIKTGKYYEIPSVPLNWMGSPPSVQRFLGMLWLSELLYGDSADIDLRSEAAELFELFYHCELSPQQFDELTRNSIGRK